MRQINNQFSPTLGAVLTKPTPNIFAPIANTFSNLGTLVDNQENKEQNRKKVKHNIFMDQWNMNLKKASIYDHFLDTATDREIKKNKEKRESTEFGLRIATIKNKIADNAKLAKLFHSGQTYSDFTKEHGAFVTPSATKNAMDFSNRNKTLMNESEYKKQLDFIKTNPKFITDGVFDTEKATSFIGRKLKRGEISQEKAVSMIDGLHKATNYGIYSKNKAEQTYAPTEAMKAYKENLLSISDREERNKYRKEHPFVSFRNEYNDAKKMSSGVSSTNLINTAISDFQDRYGIKDFANYDFSNGIKKGEISTYEVEALKRVMANSKQAQTLDGQMAKKAGAFGTLAGQAGNFARYAQSDNVDTNLFKAKVDEIKTYIPGLEYSDKEIENEDFRRDFLNITSTLLKLQSGLTVSDKEVARFEQSMGTFSRNKTTNFIGVKKKLEDIKNDFMGIKSIDPQYFNLKYGKTLRGLDSSLSIIDKAISGNKEEDINNRQQHPQGQSQEDNKTWETL